jgi:mono/diheme cytochrome c family protein
VSAQSKNPIWDGVYTSAQAERGRIVVQNHCSECHHEDLSGGEGPPLVGETFMVNWETHSLERLFHKIRDTMPSRGDDSVTHQQKLDALAYMLQQNGFPAGASELTDSALLANLQIVSKDGSATPRAGALVHAVGCLQDGRGSDPWKLSQSTTPRVTTLDPPSRDEFALQRDSRADKRAETSLGSETIGLVNVFPSPTAYKGHKVSVKGLLIRTSTDTSINVLSLESLAPTCP